VTQAWPGSIGLIGAGAMGRAFAAGLVRGRPDAADGLLVSDDLSMKALRGPMRARAEAVIAAGSDLALHCNGDLAEMRAAAAGVPRLQGRAAERFAAASACATRRDAYDRAEALQLLASLMGEPTPIV